MAHTPQANGTSLKTPNMGNPGYNSLLGAGLLLCLMLAVLLAACVDEPTSTSTPVPTSTPTPTRTPSPSVSQGPDATEVTDQAGSAALRFADANCGAGIRPDQAGPGIPAVPAAGTGEGERRMVADLHRPQPAQTVPLWGQSAQESTGRWASPTHQELLPR